jgi:hypothetical protein
MAFVSLKDTIRNWFAGEPVKIEEGGTGATTAENACLNLGAVKKSGDTVDGKLNMGNNSGIKSSDSSEAFMFRDADANIRCALKLSSENRFFVSQRETGNTKSECYQLPSLTTDELTADRWYNILTNRDPVTIAQGGTGSSNGATGLAQLFASGPTILSEKQYGNTLPAAGNPGRIFFKKLDG